MVSLFEQIGADFKKNDFNAYEVTEEFLTQLPPVNAMVCSACGVAPKPGLIIFVFQFSCQLHMSDDLKAEKKKKKKKKSMTASIIKIHYAS